MIKTYSLVNAYADGNELGIVVGEAHHLQSQEPESSFLEPDSMTFKSLSSVLMFQFNF